MSTLIPYKDAPRILIIIPGGANYFYDALGKRLAEAFRNLGCHVDVRLLKTYQPAEYDLTLYVNLYEIVFMHAMGYPSAARVEYLTQNEYQPDFTGALRIIAAIQQRTTHSGVILLDCVQTEWFARNHHFARTAGIHTLYDLGFHSQAHLLTDHSIPYRFVFNALTEQERQKVAAHQADQRERTIPWAFIGHISPNRLPFAHRLIQQLGAEGVFYLPIIRPISSDGPHFNEAQLQRLLENTRYYIWVSHHSYFYVESERFRSAVLAGCVPIKVQRRDRAVNAVDLPFKYLLLDEADFNEHLQMLDYERLRQRFLKDYLAMPSLEAMLAQELLKQQVQP